MQPTKGLQPLFVWNVSGELAVSGRKFHYWLSHLELGLTFFVTSQSQSELEVWQRLC